MEKNKEQRHEHDMHWKAIISKHFKDFIAFFLPELYPHIDFSVKEVSLEQEFFKLFPNAEKGKTFKDKLFKVKLLNGEEYFILIHIEIQSYDPAQLPSRMFKYFYRIIDKYNLKVTALAVYTTETVPENHDRYIYDCFGTKNTYEFNTYLVHDHDEEELLASKNPFALVVLAAKLLNKSKKDKPTRYRYKYKLIKIALKHGYPSETIRSLLTFIHFLLILPKEMDDQLLHELTDATHKKADMNSNTSPDFLDRLVERLAEVRHNESVQDFQNKIEEAKHEATEAKQKVMEAKHQATEAKHQATEAKHQATEAKHQATEAKQKAMEAEQKVMEVKQKTETLAKELLKTGMSPEKIASLANLPIEEINNLKAEL